MSFGERGGRMDLVDGGSILVGWPGAPGRTTTGAAFESDCCALIGSDKKKVSAATAIRPLRDTATFITDRILIMVLKKTDCIRLEVNSHSAFKCNKYGQTPKRFNGAENIGAPEWIRTTGLSLRRRTLYPTELREQIRFGTMNRNVLKIVHHNHRISDGH